MLTPGTKVYYKGKVHEIDMVGATECTLVGVRGKVPLDQVKDVLAQNAIRAQALVDDALGLLQEALEVISDEPTGGYTDLNQAGFDLCKIASVLGLDPEYWKSSSARC